MWSQQYEETASGKGVKFAHLKNNNVSGKGVKFAL